MAGEVQRRYWRTEAKKRYWADPEKKREAVRRWRRENPERYAEVKREYRKRRRERLAQGSAGNTMGQPSGTHGQGA